MKGEKGFSLMEVALAMALLGVVATAFLVGLATGSKALMIADERATAESLARTQMEYIRQQNYDANLDTGHPVYQKISDIPDNYEIDIEAVRPDYNGDGENDDGIQHITVTVTHTVEGEPKEIFTLTGYRSRR